MTFDPERREHEYIIVPLDKLPGFVNSAEWNLGPSYKIYVVLTISYGHNILPRYKFYSLRSSPLHPSSSPRIDNLNAIPPEFLLPPSMGRNTNIQSSARDKTSRHQFLTPRILNIHYALTESPWNTCAVGFYSCGGKNNTISLAIRRSRPSTCCRESCGCGRNDGKFSSSRP